MRYLEHMNKSLFLIALLLPGLAQAVICKIVDPDGGVTYTDVPLAECPNRVNLPPSSTYAPRPLPTQDAAGQPTQTQTQTRQPFDGYVSMRIVQPATGAEVRSNEGKVEVGLAVEPGLQTGHLVSLVLDGKDYPGNFPATAMVLQGVERGVHSLRAKIKDANGALLIESQTVQFSLRKLGQEDTVAPVLTVDNVTSDDIISTSEAAAGGSLDVTGSLSGAAAPGARITLRVNGRTYTTTVKSDGTWSIPVRVSDLVADNSIEATATGSGFRVSTTSAHTVQGYQAGKSYAPPIAPDYTPEKPNYKPPSGGISTTPGQTNPAFKPNFKP